MPQHDRHYATALPPGTNHETFETMTSAAAELEWPVDADLVIRGRKFLAACAGQRTVVACDSDVDGLASAVILERALERHRAQAAIVPVRRGEHVHSESTRSRILAADPTRLVVADLGSRPASIVPGLPTLVVDHHDASAGVPPDALVLNGWDREPVATSSVLAYVVADAPETDGWLAALGAVADLGSAKAFATLLPRRHRETALRKVASLLNAARRAPDPHPDLALAVLRRARHVDDVWSGSHPDVAQLETMRREVHGETERCSRVPPEVLGEAALIRFTSGAQVHPIVAIRWARRLHDRIVIAANDGYLPGRTNFAVRSALDIDLVAWLRSLPFTPHDPGEFANGHRRATGGSLSHADFERFLQALT
jgi:single-stranded-DNA-specific exonuclease